MILKKYLSNFVYKSFVLVLSLLFFATCDPQNHKVLVKLVYVYDNYVEDSIFQKQIENKYGKYPRKLIYGYNVKNTSNTIEYLPFQCDLDSTFTSYFKVTCRNYKFKVKTMLNNIWKKQHFFILPEQSLPIEFLIEIPSEISKHTTIELTKEINVTYRMSVVNLIFPTNVVLDNSCYQLFHKGKESFPKSVCGPF